MIIYLAARYSRREELAGYARELESLGHTVTSRWLSGDHTIDDVEDGDSGVINPEKDARRAQYALEDIEDVLAADTIISFTEEPRTTWTRGGRHVEYGIALAMGLRTMFVGPRENIFHWAEGAEFFPTWQELLKVL